MNLPNIRLYLELALVAILVIFFLLWRFEKGKAANIQINAKAKTTIDHPQAAVIGTHKDTAGDVHITVSANSGMIPEDALKDTTVTDRSIIDTAAKAMNIKPQQLLELTRENLQLKAENIQLKAQGKTRDTLSYNDKWLKLLYFPKTDKATVNYNVNLVTGKYTPASWLPFSHKPPVLDFSADDPRATINSVDHLKTIIPEPFFGFTADVKGMYDFSSGQITPSIGANLRLGRWHVEDRAYYNLKLKQAAFLSYDLVKF